MSTALVWFRRDLRVHDHPALARAAREHVHVVPVFVLDPVLLGGRARSANRTAFMLGCLTALDVELRDRGAGLVIRRGRPEDELACLASETGAEDVLWTGDVSPYGLDRRRSGALLPPHVQPDAPAAQSSTPTARTSGAGCPSWRARRSTGCSSRGA